MKKPKAWLICLMVGETARRRRALVVPVLAYFLLGRRGLFDH